MRMRCHCSGRSALVGSLFVVLAISYTLTRIPSVAATTEKSITYHALFVPNDPLWPLQWNLQRMNIPAAWDAAEQTPPPGGDPRVVVAVLDSGLASTSVGSAASVPDFISGHLWTNSGEVSGDGLDNDHNGYVDDVHGWNFVKNTNSPADDNGHGTHIANTIAAGTNNAIATAGIAGNVTIMPLKVLNNRGTGRTAELASAVAYAMAQHVQIINLSLGSDEDDPVFHQVLQQAAAQGIVIIGAAGNKGTSPVTYPAAYDEVISVGALNTDDTRASYSNFGQALDVVAPGGNTAVDLNHDGQPDGIPAQMCLDGSCTSFDTIYVAGTSQAAAEVTGVVALLESCGAQSGDVRALLQQTATDLGAGGRDDIFGFGLINAAAAMHAAGCAPSAPPAPTDITVSSNTLHSVPLSVTGVYPYIRPRFVWNGPAGATYMVVWRKGSRVITRTQQTANTFVPSITSAATYRLTVSTVTPLGLTSDPVDITYTYQPTTLVVSAGTTIRSMSPQLTTLRTTTAPFRTSGVRVNGADIGSNGQSRLIVSAQPQGSGLALLDDRGSTLSIVTPFGKKFSGTMDTVRVMNDDGTKRIVVGTASNGGTIAWLTATGRPIGQNLVFPKYTGGVSLAAGDITGDGHDSLVVAQTAGPAIVIYNAQRQKVATYYPRGTKYTAGWTVAVGDLDGNGVAEIIAMPRLTGAAVKTLVLDNSGVQRGTVSISGAGAGLLFTVRDITGDGKVEFITAPSRGAGSLRVLSSTGALIRQIKLSATNYRSLSSF